MNHLILTFSSVEPDYLALGKVAFLQKFASEQEASVIMEGTLKNKQTNKKTVGDYWKHYYRKVK